MIFIHFLQKLFFFIWKFIINILFVSENKLMKRPVVLVVCICFLAAIADLLAFLQKLASLKYQKIPLQDFFKDLPFRQFIH